MIPRWKISVAALSYCALALGTMDVRAQDEELESKVKAAYLGNFGMYVTWPAAIKGIPKDEFHIGVLGNEAVVPHLKRFAAAKQVQQRTVVVRHFKSPEDIRPCQILFVPAESAAQKDDAYMNRLAEAKKKLGHEPVLLVADCAGATQNGAAINFYLEDARIKFEISVEATKGAGLQVNSRLLKLGKIVTTK